LAQAGHRVELFERDQIMAATSSASTKLLHGGLRYLETGQIRLVWEALHERAWWIGRAPHLAKPIRLLLPLYGNSSRSPWQVRLGLVLYDILATGSGFPRHRWHSAKQMVQLNPNLRADGLCGGFSFHDAQMDDRALGLWAAEQARTVGVVIHAGCEITGIDTTGELNIGQQVRRFDQIINVAGPWAEQLLRRAGIVSKYRLDLVRGSHIIFKQPCPAGCLLQVPGERRIFFVLPYQDKTLVGTTEVRQSLDQLIECDDDEAGYLLDAYNSYFCAKKAAADIVGRFSGLRPLVHSAADPSQATREYAIERHGLLTTVFGGKWTTARQLGLAVARQLQ
jgi:glycerol-3-phosphate dehydrogenase